MALTRKFLSALKIEDDTAEEIIKAHLETVDPIKSERDKYKEDAEKLPAIQKELDKLKEEAKKTAENGDKDPYKVKYEAIKEEFENYKKDIADKEVKAKKTDAYKKLLKDAGVSEKRIEAVLKVSNVDGIEFDDEGKVKDSETLTKNIKEEWADFIQTSSTAGAKVANPPSQSSGEKPDLGKLSMEDYIKARKEMN